MQGTGRCVEAEPANRFPALGTLPGPGQGATSAAIPRAGWVSLEAYLGHQGIRC